MADRISEEPIVAPADDATRPPGLVQEGMSKIRTGGPGWPTDLACGACGNSAGNLQIWCSWWCSQNGDATSNDEIRCARCRMYSLYIHEH
jgi:hypothetical protein